MRYVIYMVQDVAPHHWQPPGRTGSSVGVASTHSRAVLGPGAVGRLGAGSAWRAAPAKHQAWNLGNGKDGKVLNGVDSFTNRIRANRTTVHER